MWELKTESTNIDHDKTYSTWSKKKIVTHLCDLFQKLKLLDIVIPLDSEPIGYWFQTLPNFLWGATNNPLPLVTAEKRSYLRKIVSKLN